MTNPGTIDPDAWRHDLAALAEPAFLCYICGEHVEAPEVSRVVNHKIKLCRCKACVEAEPQPFERSTP